MSPEFSSTNTGLVVSPSQIQYSLITTHDRVVVNDFFSVAFSMLKFFPKDLLQLENSLNYFRLFYKTGIKKGLNLYSLPSQIFSGTSEENYLIFESYSNMFNKDLVKVFLIDSDIDNHESIGSLIKKSQFGYFMFIGDQSAENAKFYDLSKSFSDAYELISLIEKDMEGINEIIEKEYDKKIGAFDLAVDPRANELNPDYPTLYSHTNYFILNQILANYWLEKPVEREPELFTGDRTQIMLKQCEVIDQLHIWVKEVKPVTPIEPYLPAMVIAAPFHFPKHGKLRKNQFENKKQRMWFRVSQTEQLPDYTYGVEEDIAGYLKRDEIAQVLKILTERLMMLDNFGYLHAQLSFSPYYRLPVIGKSLNSDLSHFQKGFTDKKTAIKKMNKVGEIMREKVLPDELRNMLAERNGQLVFITDLPVEWMILDKYPLLLTHDICRIPEFNHNSLVNNFIHNQRLLFSIKPDIIKRTLIIHCADETDAQMQELFKMFADLQPKLGFTSVICKSVEDISSAVKEYKPDLLIFDCHGDFDEQDLSSFLIIDAKKNILLTGDDIVKHNIAAPLVFISACSTMPNYGYVKFLSDAFFQAGAFAVTATFLPIKMRDAAVLLVRILHNLKQQHNTTIFSNWLAFISHSLRSILIFETVRKEQLRNNLPDQPDQKKIADILLELMLFDTRGAAFENLQDYLKTINPGITALFENLDHEWLSYTTVGRADLIYFENWLHDHQTANFGSVVAEKI